MTKAIVAALLAASSILPGVASAQDQAGRRDRPQLTQAQREARAERRAERQTAGGDERRQRPQAARPDRQNDEARRFAGRNDGRVDARGRFDRDGRFDGDGRYDRRGDPRGGFERRGYDAGRPAVRAPQRWSRDWRADGRYDWNRYRSYNRSAFRLPRYFAPGGWGYGYRRFGVGVRIAAPFFGENYWIDDPWEFRLPPAYGPYRWVRYYDDALLIDLRTGYVVDAEYGIFW